MGVLIKDRDSVLVPGTPGVPGIPGTAPVPAITFRLVATPSPPNYKYRYRGASTFHSLAQITADGGEIPEGSVPVFDTGSGGALLGYDFPGPVVIAGPADFAGWSQIEASAGLWGPIPNMTFVSFRDVARLANGYPAPSVSGTITGYYTLPTVSGGNTEFTQQYRKTGPNGWWMPIAPLSIAYTEVRGATSVRMLSGFPGSPGSEGTPGVPEVPDRSEPVWLQGWGTGANSIEQYGNDLRLTFNANVFGAGIVGFTNDLSGGIDRAQITHGFYFDTSLVTPRVRIIERGSIVGPFSDDYSAATDEFKIERIDGVVTYFVNGAAVQTSRNLSGGETVVRTALYRSDDSVGGDY